MSRAVAPPTHPCVSQAGMGEACPARRDVNFPLFNLSHRFLSLFYSVAWNFLKASMT